VTPRDRLESRLAAARAEQRLALLPYLVAGFPQARGFERLLARVAERADVVELGLPFSDPTADGPAIAAAARRALANGAHLGWVCEVASRVRERSRAGLVLMSYLNPLLALGLGHSVDELVTAGFEGLVVPDLPLEEGAELRALADERGLALVELVTPLTPRDRARAIAQASRGFLYAVTRSGTTGARVDPAAIAGYLRELRALSPLAVCAGFGLRDAAQVRALRGAADGVVVGTALIELQARGEDPVPFLETLRAACSPAGAFP
jgi:tryptophan synthase alpha chain